MNALQESIQSHALFDGMKPEYLAKISKGAAIVHHQPGEILFRQGEPANRLLLVEKGSIALEAHKPADGTVRVETLHAGDVFGWSWLFPPFVWHFQARALEPTDILALDGAHLLILCEQNHQFGYELMKRMAQVVIHQLKATCERLLALKSRTSAEDEPARGRPGP